MRFCRSKGTLGQTLAIISASQTSVLWLLFALHTVCCIPHALTQQCLFVHTGITARIEAAAYGVDVFLLCDGSGAGRGGGEQKDVLPPLMPGLKARQQ